MFSQFESTSPAYTWIQWVKLYKKKVRQDTYPDQALNPMPPVYKSQVTPRRQGKQWRRAAWRKRIRLLLWRLNATRPRPGLGVVSCVKLHFPLRLPVTPDNLQAVVTATLPPVKKKTGFCRQGPRTRLLGRFHALTKYARSPSRSGRFTPAVSLSTL
jgi:hypothetical protein